MEASDRYRAAFNAIMLIADGRLSKLREPFPPSHISKLPKPTKAQTEAVRADFKKGIRCNLCGAWHHPDVIHLDYVGHAALTDRLLDTDPEWSWEPMMLRDGLPAFDITGGLWIKLTVCGVTRLGYGHAETKQNADPGSREKEVIGDALRNAAMRFGAALDLWHKGDLHVEEQSEKKQSSPATDSVQEKTKGRQKLEGPHGTATALKEAAKKLMAEAGGLEDRMAFDAWAKASEPTFAQVRQYLPKWWVGEGDNIGMKRRLDEIYDALPGDATAGTVDEPKEEKSLYSTLIASLGKTQTKVALTKWFKEHEDEVKSLPDADRENLRSSYVNHEASIAAMDASAA